MPSKWKPHSVVNPESGEVFTDAGAWDFVASLLENGHPIEEIILDKPPGKKAYVLIVEIKTTSRNLYIKIQLGSGVIWGRSFHYSEYDK